MGPDVIQGDPDEECRARVPIGHHPLCSHQQLYPGVLANAGVKITPIQSSPGEKLITEYYNAKYSHDSNTGIQILCCETICLV